MEQSSRQVNIKTISNEIKTLTVPSHIPITDFKIKVQEAFSVPVDKQRLICQGKLLKDEHTLNDYVKEDGQTVHLMIKAEAPSGPNPSPGVPQGVPAGMPNMGNMPNMPFQFDQLINSMVSGFLPAAAQGRPAVNVNIGPIFPGQNLPQAGNLAPPPPFGVFSMHQNTNPPHAPHSQPAPPNQPNPRPHVEISLPFDRVHNLGAIVNELHGNGASFPPPRMPQLPFPRNPMTLLGGFLHNYEFQLLRFLPFVSRLSDLLQRESLITDPNERAQLQALSQRVALGLTEISVATQPVATMLAQLSVGQAPGQFQLRIGNMNVSNEVRHMPPEGQNLGHQGSNPPNQGVSQNLPNQGVSPNLPNQGVRPNLPNQGVSPNIPVSGNNPGASPNIPNPFAGPNAGNSLNLNPANLLNLLQGNIGQASNLSQPNPPNSSNPAVNMQEGIPNLFSMMPMFSQILGSNQAMTIRDLINTLNIHDEEESLPLMDFFYNLNISEVISLASGNWEPIERQRPAVRESLLKLMEGDSAEGRERIVKILINYIQRQYSIPSDFSSQVLNGFDPVNMINEIGNRWLLKIITHVMDYSGTNFVAEFKKLIFLLIGNYVSEMCANVQGGMQTVQNIVQVQMARALERMIPPEFMGMIQGMMGGIISGYFYSSKTIYEEWLAANRVQEEAKESQSPAGSLLSTWQATISRDLQTEIRPQAPFSRSYQSSDIFAPSSNSPSMQEVFAGILNSSVADQGVNLNTQSVPPEVVREFIQNWTLGVNERLRQDSDFRHGRFENLDRLHK